MKHLLIAIMVMWSASVFAEEAEIEENIMIIRPEENNKVESNEALLKCDEPRLIEEVKSAVAKYVAEHDTGSIIEQRKRKLILKNLNRYTELSIADFNNEENYLVANEIGI